MGYDISLKTENIFNAYLTLGLLEIHKEESNDNYLTSGKILEIIDDKDNIPASNYIGRYLDDFEKWLRERADFSEEQIELLLDRTPSGYRLKSQIIQSAYKDYIGAFLHLALIEDEKHKDFINDLINKEGEKALSIITKLILAKRKETQVEIKYQNDNGREDTHQFKPLYFSLENNIWYIVGENHPKLILSRINYIELPPNILNF